MQKNTFNIMQKTLLQVLKRYHSDRIPIWFMRQAGRYLPEYLELKRQYSFMEMALTPEIASVVTLQPLKRFDLDGAIIFSDILMVLKMLGVKVEFIQGLIIDRDINILNTELNYDIITKVAQAITLTKKELSLHYPHVTMIGFAGGPWTVASYLFNDIKTQSHDRLFDEIINKLMETTIIYLEAQIQAGAEVIKIFESAAIKAGVKNFIKYIIKPLDIIIKYLKNKYPEIPIIVFLKDTQLLYNNLNMDLNVDCFAIDDNIPINNIQTMQSKYVIQGNLDNTLITLDHIDVPLQNNIHYILKNLWHRKNFIFNLNHGVLPNTQIQNIEKIIQIVREYEKL